MSTIPVPISALLDVAHATPNPKYAMSLLLGSPPQLFIDHRTNQHGRPVVFREYNPWTNQVTYLTPKGKWYRKGIVREGEEEQPLMDGDYYRNSEKGRIYFQAEESGDYKTDSMSREDWNELSTMRPEEQQLFI